MTDKERENVAALRCLTEDDCICFPNVALTAMRDAADLIESLSKQCDDQNEMLHWAYGILKKLDKGLEEHGFDSFEEVYAQLEQVTRERDALQVEIDVLNEEYYAGIHTIRPTVDAEPVRHGRWTFPWTSPECSVCKKTQKWTSKYCPNCGAKMDGDKDAFD